MPRTHLRALVRAAEDRVIDFAQRLLRTPSLSSQEGPATELIAAEMRALGYDEIGADAAGNVLGKVCGQSAKSKLLLHAHMDVVDPGDPSRWTYPPFSGAVADGHLWGRGACDDKGCIVAQVYAVGLLREAGLIPPRDTYVAAVVNEETAGLGTKVLLRSFVPDVAIIGEPSGNVLRRGHRGRFEFILSWRGRSAHASVPEEGLNPHYSMARFLLALREAPLAVEPVFGGTSVSPTLSCVDQTSSNVIPAEVRLHLDWRNAPGESLEDARSLLTRLLRETADPGVSTDLVLRTRAMRTYTGYEETIQLDARPFLRAEDDPLVHSAQRALEEALGRPVPVDVWRFCTDGGFIAAEGVPCVGFGPGEPTMAHVVDERLEIAQLLEAVAGYMGLALDLGDVGR